jgi:anti-anti-sigma regulatory factor
MDMSAESSQRCVRLHGSLTLRDAKQVCGLLQEAINSSRQVEVDVSEVSSVDVSIIQLIASARKSVEQRGRKLLLMRAPWP